ncbi:MAG: ankyrin repeat domain-containing protein [Gammaproteobacteria bacterium]|nr:ankyrin repeat domain-containing protein [Gammaproteobacteria bacterium]
MNETPGAMERALFRLLDFHYGADGDEVLRRILAGGADPDVRSGVYAETPLHVATRRRRRRAVDILLDHGAGIDAGTAGGKTAYAHAVRRGFDEVANLLVNRGADSGLNEADRFAVAIVNGRLDEARAILKANPGVARTGNPEEDRLLADVAGRADREPVKLLIQAGADLTATGLDSGTPLHQSAWFGQPRNARLLLDAGAPVDVFDDIHESSPLHWAVHGSRYSGGAEERQDAYVELVEMLLAAGSGLHHPDDPDGDAYRKRLLGDASPSVRRVLQGIPGQ